MKLLFVAIAFFAAFAYAENAEGTYYADLSQFNLIV